MKTNLLKIHPTDNIAVVTTDVAQGQLISGAGLQMKTVRKLSLGDKVALRQLMPGDKVYKYGLPIGSVTKMAAKGEWIHLHNMHSDYVPTYVFDSSDKEQK